MATRSSILAFLWLAVAALVTAQSQTSAPQDPTFRAGTQSVRVDLYVTKDGKPVTDLRADEVELFEDGVAHTIQTFQRIAVAPPTSAPPAAPRSLAERRRMASDPRYRLFVVFVPLPARSSGSDVLVQVERRTLIEQINSLLGPDDLVAVMTSDMRVEDLTFERRLPLTISAWPTQSEDPRYALWDACYPAAFPGSPNGEMKGRYQELIAFEALDALIAQLGGLRDERKHVLILSNGFRQYTKNMELSTRGRPGTAAGTPTTGGSTVPGVVPRPGESPGSMISSRDCESDLRDLASLDHARRLDQIAANARLNNVTLYPIMPSALGRRPTRRQTGGAFNPGAFARRDALRELAEDTDGMAIVDADDVEPTLKKMMASTSNYYLLSYTPANTAADGKFRRITVKVKRGGTQLRARPGYVATTLNMTPAEMRPAAPVETSAPPDRVSTALSDLTRTTPGFLHVRTVSWMRGNPSGAPASSLWVVGELDSQLRNKAPWTSGGSAEITLRSVSGGAPITRKVDIAAANPVAEFDLSDAGLGPGVYGVQLQFLAPDGEPVGDFMRITVAAEPTPLGEPILSRRLSSPGQRYSRTADPRFRKNELVRFELPTMSSDPVTARLLDSRGSALSVPVQTSERPDASGAFRWIVAEFPATPLAPAYYAVEVKQGSSSHVTAFQVIP